MPLRVLLSSKSLLRRITLALLASVVWLVMNVSALLAQTPPVQLWYITFTSAAELQQLAAELDLWEVDHGTGRVLAALTDEQANVLRANHTLTLAPDQSPLAVSPAAVAQAGGIPNFPCYRTTDETFATHTQLVAQYPNLVREIDIGDSWDKSVAGGPAGDDLRVLVITNQATPGPKFRFLLMGALHPREYVTSELALRFAETLLEEYGRDATATYLLDYGELHLLTIANPDGRRIAEGGQLWRKNTNTDAACSITSLPALSYGVDLNRNSSFKWNECDGFSCSSSDSCRETYRGPAPGSEPETIAIERYLRELFPDARGDEISDAAALSTPGLFISLHSYGRLILYPWGYTTNFAPNAAGLATLARRLGHPLDYTVCQSGGAGCLYQTDGTTDDYAYGDLGVASFTIELGTAFFQSCTYFENLILQQALAALRYAFTAAPQPYRLAHGPESLNVMASLHTTEAISGTASLSTTHVTISATLDATRMASLTGAGVGPITEPAHPIRAASVTVDSPPWLNSAYTYRFASRDGAFDSVREEATATVEVACLSSGRHTFFVQAEDSAGDVGVVAATFVTVTNDSELAVSAQPTQTAIQAGSAATYTLFVTNTATTTTTFAVESLGEASVTITPSQPFTLPAATATQFAVTVAPQNITADTNVPTVITVRVLGDAATCRQVQLVTGVDAWAYRQRLLQIYRD
jgi:hypothetical protein